MIEAKGIAALSAKEPLRPFSFQRRVPKDSDVVIDIKYCGICHSDIHQARDEWGGSIYPMVPGHEITGIVRSVGSKVKRFKAGDRVGVGCFVDSCRECAQCKQNIEQYCDENVGTYNAYERDGKTATYGGYSNIIVVDQNYVLNIPESISLDKAAPLLCAGITLYSPLKHWHAGSGKKIAIIGLGGLGHMGVKIAVALGAEVSVLSHSENKRENALQMGAHHFVCTTDDEIFKKYDSHFDLIINTVSADINMSDYFGLLKLNGTLVVVGVPDKPLSIHPMPLVGRRRSYAGSLIGSIKETQEMLNFCAQNNIQPEIEMIIPSEINNAYERVLKSNVKYRFVIDMTRL